MVMRTTTIALPYIVVLAATMPDAECHPADT